MVDRILVLFNLCYQDMAGELLETVGGIRINGVPYSVICYADVILIYSTTVTGLQCLIGVYNGYKPGLSFNPAKTHGVSCLESASL